MIRGPQFPTLNESHFQHRDNPTPNFPGQYTHTSQHGEYTIEHVFHGDQHDGYGIIRVKHPSFKLGGNPWELAEDVDRWGNTEAGTVASLKYDLDKAPRATTLRSQPLTHTEYIHVHDDHRGKGLTSVMQSVLQRAHPGAPNIASNDLTDAGSQWRVHMAKSLRDPGRGQRLGMSSPRSQYDEGELQVFRPAEGQPPDALLHDEWIDDSDRRVAKKR